MDLKHTFKDLKDIDSFKARFNSEEVCLKAIADDKWSAGYTCRKCGHNHYCEGKTPHSRRCTRCKADESATAHSLFHHCRIKILDAFELAYRICCAPEVSSYELSRKMHARQMTCWKFKKRIQEFAKIDG